MSKLLDLARKQQAAHRAAALPAPIDAGPTLADQASARLAMARTYPRGVALLAWCQEHPVEAAANAGLVENLRRAMASSVFIGEHLLALYGAIPEACDIEPIKAQKVPR